MLAGMNGGALGRIAFALALGAFGGWVADLLTMPLPWMLGPMCVCTAAAVLKAPVQGPMPLRPPMIMVLGVMLGSGFTPDMVDHLATWTLSLALLVVYVAVIGLIAYPYFRRVGGYDPVTAYFSAMPGGLNEMMIVGSAMGGDERRIALTHASRVLIAVFLIPIWFRLFEGLDMSDRASFGVSIIDIPPPDLAILAACAAVGYPLAHLLRLPAKLLVGPMLASAAVHLTGITHSPPPLEIVNLAQWIIGTVIGCRFVGVATREVLLVLKLGAGSTAIMLLVGVGFAWLLFGISGLDPTQVVLAYAPGGLAEMSLVALALGAEVAFVATHHVWRIGLIVIAAPLVFRLTPMHSTRRERQAAESD